MPTCGETPLLRSLLKSRQGQPQSGRSSQSLSAHVIFDNCESLIRALGREASVPHLTRPSGAKHQADADASSAFPSGRSDGTGALHPARQGVLPEGLSIALRRPEPFGFALRASASSAIAREKSYKLKFSS